MGMLVQTGRAAFGLGVVEVPGRPFRREVARRGAWSGPPRDSISGSTWIPGFEPVFPSIRGFCRFSSSGPVSHPVGVRWVPGGVRLGPAVCPDLTRTSPGRATGPEGRSFEHPAGRAGRQRTCPGTRPAIRLGSSRSRSQPGRNARPGLPRRPGGLPGGPGEVLLHRPGRAPLELPRRARVAHTRGSTSAGRLPGAGVPPPAPHASRPPRTRAASHADRAHRGAGRAWRCTGPAPGGR